VTIAGPESTDFEIEVPSELADLARSLMFGDFDLEGATVEGDRVTLSFTTLDGMDSFIALCLRPSPDGLSERIAGENEEGEKVEEPWRYTIRPNSIFITTGSSEPNIVWSSSASFAREDLAEVEARVRSRPVEFVVFMDEPRRPESGTSQRWQAKTKAEALREAIDELERREFLRARVIRFDPASGAVEEQVPHGGLETPGPVRTSARHRRRAQRSLVALISFIGYSVRTRRETRCPQPPHLTTSSALTRPSRTTSSSCANS
jgi:hypothetical protein